MHPMARYSLSDKDRDYERSGDNDNRQQYVKYPFQHFCPRLTYRFAPTSIIYCYVCLLQVLTRLLPDTAANQLLLSAFLHPI